MSKTTYINKKPFQIRGDRMDYWLSGVKDTTLMKDEMGSLLSQTQNNFHMHIKDEKVQVKTI